MKKLQLNLSNVKGQALTRAQLKNVLGGTGTCAVTWNNGTATGTINIDQSSSATRVVNPNGTITYTFYGVSKDTATGAFNNGGSSARWCCDSCSSAGWYSPPPTTLPGEEPPVE